VPHLWLLMTLNQTDVLQAPEEDQGSKKDRGRKRRDQGPRASPAERKAKWRSRLLRWPVQAGILIGILSVWEFTSGRFFDSYYLSAPSDIGAKFMAWIEDGTLAHHASTTLASSVLGFMIGGVLAIAIGYALGVSRYWSSVIQPFITALWGLPRIALIPLLVIWVGIGQPLAVSIAAILSFFILFYNTYYGVREVSQGLIDSVRIMGGGRLDVALRVRFPSALVWVAAGIKMSMPMALVGTVTAEMLASNVGLGYLVQFSANSFDTTGTFASLFALLLLGFALERILSLLSARALVWKSPN
jgi:NitT/TauT family transport system permease protein